MGECCYNCDVFAGVYTWGSVAIIAMCLQVCTRGGSGGRAVRHVRRGYGRGGRGAWSRRVWGPAGRPPSVNSSLTVTVSRA